MQRDKITCGTTIDLLKARQAYPLDGKVHLTKQRIKEWYEYWEGQVYISFSGGKDSTVLLHLVRSMYPEVPAVFLDTGLEYPEIKEFVKTVDNVVWLRPKMSFFQVIKKYGYPLISKEVAQKIDEIRNTKSDKLRNKRLNGDAKGNGKLSKKWQYLIQCPHKISGKCCDVLKKRPVKKYEKESKRKGFIGTMASDSSLRATSYIKTGCNAFSSQRPISLPLAFWMEADIWEYLKVNELKYSPIYDMGYTRTGCMFCLFGVQHEKTENRFQRMKITHPKYYNYCVNTLGLGKLLDIINVSY